MSTEDGPLSVKFGFANDLPHVVFAPNQGRSWPFIGQLRPTLGGQHWAVWSVICPISVGPNLGRSWPEFRHDSLVEPAILESL